jgi:hypothetical protein
LASSSFFIIAFEPLVYTALRGEHQWLMAVI